MTVNQERKLTKGMASDIRHSVRRPSSFGNPISWSTLYAHRKAAAARFGKTVFELPLVKRAKQVLLSQVSATDRVLEVGAGERRMKVVLDKERPGVVYHSLDIDPAGDHDYREWSQVDELYDCVFAFEVIEHLSLDEIPAWLSALSGRLRMGGRLVLSTPNTFYPPAYLRDATHRTPLCYDELAGLAAAAGFEVQQIYRVYHDPLHRMLLRRYLFGWLFRLLGLDFARQIVLVARKEGSGFGVQDAVGSRQ
jgi:hypothetical protein